MKYLNIAKAYLKNERNEKSVINETNLIKIQNDTPAFAHNATIVSIFDFQLIFPQNLLAWLLFTALY